MLIDKRITESRGGRQWGLPEAACLVLSALFLSSCGWLKAFDLGKNPRAWGQACEIRISAWRLDKASGAVNAAEDWGAIRTRSAPVGASMVQSGCVVPDADAYILCFTGYDLEFVDGAHWYPERGNDFFCAVRFRGGVPGAELAYSRPESEYESLYGVMAAPGRYLVDGKYWLEESGGALALRSSLPTYDNVKGAFIRDAAGDTLFSYLQTDWESGAITEAEYRANGALASSRTFAGISGQVLRARASGASTVEALCADPLGDPYVPAPRTARLLRFGAGGAAASSAELGLIPADWTFAEYEGSGADAEFAGPAAWFKRPGRGYQNYLTDLGRLLPDGTWTELALPEEAGYHRYDCTSTGLSGGDLLLYDPGYPPTFMYSDWMDRVAEADAWARDRARARVSRWSAGPSGIVQAWRREILLVPAAMAGTVHRSWIIGTLEEASEILVVAATTRSY